MVGLGGSLFFVTPMVAQLFGAKKIEEISKRKAHTHKLLEKAGAHYVIDSIADIEPVIEDVNKRLANGERP